MDTERLKILELVANGTITAAEGEVLLDAIESSTSFEVDDPAMEIIPTTDASRMSAKPDWAQYWIYPVGIGAFLASFGFAYTVVVFTGGMGWGWAFFFIPIWILGLLLFLTGWLMRNSQWLHIRVKDHGSNIWLSLPLPLNWVGGLIRIARPYIPQLQDRVVDDLVEMLADGMPDGLFNIEVYEDTGEYVRVYYG